MKLRGGKSEMVQEDLETLLQRMMKADSNDIKSAEEEFEARASDPHTATALIAYVLTTAAPTELRQLAAIVRIIQA